MGKSGQSHTCKKRSRGSMPNPKTHQKIFPVYATQAAYAEIFRKNDDFLDFLGDFISN